MSLKHVIDENKIELETVSCAQCGSVKSETFIVSSDIKQGCERDYHTVKCEECGLVYLNPRPTKKSIMDYYLEDDPEKTRRKPAFYEKIYFKLFRRIPLKEKGTLLDVGCGSGRYIYCMKKNGWDVKGIDVAHTDYGREVLGLDITQGEFATAGLKADSFDAITLWWTLEHMYEPLTVLKEAHRVLKKGGVVIAAVHNSASFEASIFKKYWFHLFLPKHLYHFSPKTLRAVFEKAGFKRVKIRHDPFSFGTIGSFQLYLNKKGKKVRFTNPFFYGLSFIFDIVPFLCRRSGLITAYAYKD